jgi:hypothetical protein
MARRFCAFVALYLFGSLLFLVYSALAFEADGILTTD